MSPSSKPKQYDTTPQALVEMRRWAYEQTNQGTTDRRIKSADEIIKWVLEDPDETNES